MTKDDEIGTWTGAGVGHFTGKGFAVSFRGAIYFDTKSERFSRLKNIAVVYEWDVDENGNALFTKPEFADGIRSDPGPH